jgi:hypothetical protein
MRDRNRVGDHRRRAGKLRRPGLWRSVEPIARAVQSFVAQERGALTATAELRGYWSPVPDGAIAHIILCLADGVACAHSANMSANA